MNDRQHEPRKKSRAPMGVLTRSPISLRLLPEEKEALAELAQQQGSSLACMARNLVLEGLTRLRRRERAAVIKER